MSPEQARGLPCDERTDIWAFGCLLYEVLTGQPLFAAASMADTLLKILSVDADLSGLPPGTPPRLRQLIQRCVRRDPKQRLRHIGDARLELQEMTFDTPPVALARRSSRFNWTAALLAALAAGVVGWFLRASEVARMPPQNIHVQRLTDLLGLEETPAISPDGKSVAFVAESGGGRPNLAAAAVGWESVRTGGHGNSMRLRALGGSSTVITRPETSIRELVLGQQNVVCTEPVS